MNVLVLCCVVLCCVVLCCDVCHCPTEESLLGAILGSVSEFCACGSVGPKAMERKGSSVFPD